MKYNIRRKANAKCSASLLMMMMILNPIRNTIPISIPVPISQPPFRFDCTYSNRRFGVGFQIARDHVKATTKLAERATNSHRPSGIGNREFEVLAQLLMVFYQPGLVWF